MLWINSDKTSTTCEIAVTWMPQNTFDEVKIGSGNGLMPSGNKPLPEPMLTQCYVGHNAFISVQVEVMNHLLD